MSTKKPNEPNIPRILNLLSSLDEDVLKAIQARGTPIIVITPASRFLDDPDDSDGDEYDDEEELVEEDGDCPEYEPAGDGTDRCAYACPECGVCLRKYIEEEFQ